MSEAYIVEPTPLAGPIHQAQPAITVKGEYRLDWPDLDDGLSGCLALLVAGCGDEDEPGRTVTAPANAKPPALA